MINIKDLKKNFTSVKKYIELKDPSFPVEKLYELYLKKNLLIQEITSFKEEINNLSEKVKNNLNLCEPIKLEVKKIKENISLKEQSLNETIKEYDNLILSCPNIPSEDLPVGTKNDNFICRKYGQKPIFNFNPKHHLDLLNNHCGEMMSFGTKVTKSGFFAYEGKVAWILYRLANICMKFNEKHGFNVVYIPQLANYNTIQNAGNLPRFQDELFFVKDSDLILIPTAEVILSSYCAGKNIDHSKLPIRLTSWTRCYRKEVGGYGANERGLIRIHEFEKIEIFSFTTEEQSEKEHIYMVETVEKLLQLFNLHYQVVLLATQDCSFSSTKTYDIELWLPGQGQYKEVSSISNCTDFQTRRSESKYTKNNKSFLMHSLNGSSLALPRLMVALIETWQNHDGIDLDGIHSKLSEIEQKI